MRHVTNVSHRPLATDPCPPSAPEDRPEAQFPPVLSEELLPLLDVLQSERQGLTLHQLACRLSTPPEGVRALLDRLVERQVVGTLNTVIPTYIYRGGGIDL